MVARYDGKIFRIKKWKEKVNRNKLMQDKISVAMATYNGEKYLRIQLESILNNLRSYDEVIISDDGSVDNTLSILSEYAEKDGRIKIVSGPNLGVIKNFENAINHCSGRYVFLSDQDDIWHNNKVENILSVFKNSKPDVILHNANILKNGEIIGTLKEKVGYRKSIFGNIIKNSFTGCCMAFDMVFSNNFLPFPDEEKITMHDWYIGLMALKKGKVEYIKHPLIDYRIHENNAVGLKKTTLAFKFKKRINILKILKKV